MEFEIEGKETDVKVFAKEIDESTIAQITRMANAKTFGGEGDAAVMEDAHWGKGACIGFTNPLKKDPLMVPPSAVGVDVGCAVDAYRLNLDEDDLHDMGLDNVKNIISENIPLGKSVNHNTQYHIKNDFPWSKANEDLEKLEDFLNAGLRYTTEVDITGSGYKPDYIQDIVSRSGISMNRAISSMGSLGGGNHFIELSVDDIGRVWLVVHTGSRGLGATTAEYWMSRATKLRDMESIRNKVEDSDYKEYLKFDPEVINNKELYSWVHGGKGESHIKKEKIREDFEGKKIDDVFSEIGNLQTDNLKSRNNDLDFLKGEEAYGYLVDMNFLQWYARENRDTIALTISENLDVEIVDSVKTMHNYISFKDGVLRKGAISAHDGELGVIPVNPAKGTFIVEGKGDSDRNFSAPHGAGRIMSRRDAKDQFDESDIDEQMEGVECLNMSLDELPGSYKDFDYIFESIKNSVNIKHHLVPRINIKG